MSLAFRIIGRESRSVEISQANAGLIRRDLLDQRERSRRADKILNC